MPRIAPIAATAMRAAIRPYSMAVAPSLSFISLTNRLNIFDLPRTERRKTPLPRVCRGRFTDTLESLQKVLKRLVFQAPRLPQSRPERRHVNSYRSEDVRPGILGEPGRGP